jgi:hypothetical protein
MGTFDEDITVENCVKEFLRFVKANNVLLAAYKNMINTVVASIDMQIAEAELVIGQLVLVASLDDVLLNAYDAQVKQLTSMFGSMGFDQFKTCPGISQLVKLLNTQIDPYNLPLIGNIKNRIYESKKRKRYIDILKQMNEFRAKLKKDLQSTLNFLNL